MGVGDRAADGPEQPERVLEGQRPDALDVPVERLAVDPLEREVGRAVVEVGRVGDRYDPGVPQPCEHARFLVEARARLGGRRDGLAAQHLDGDLDAERDRLGLVHDAEPALGDEARDEVAPVDGPADDAVRVTHRGPG
jgi:hypothetical protein